ncbi:MAG: lipopolysaccharide transport periplasmic protein LptA [Mariprofundus sp.]|nr:lipopolysaccharide transport periplasmic protein LptA [Mariprofundus sp.]
MSIQRILLRTAFMLLIGLLPAGVWAETVHIESAKMTVYHKINQVIFTKQVHLTRHDFELYCDRLVVYYTDKDLDHAEAFGNVRLLYGKARGRSDKAVLNQSKNTLTLIGNAVLEQDGNRVEGEQIIHDMNKDKTVVLPAKGGRTHMTIESTGDNSNLLPGAGKQP